MATPAIIKAYVNLIRKGIKTIEDVPASIRAEVEEALNGQ